MIGGDERPLELSQVDDISLSDRVMESCRRVVHLLRGEMRGKPVAALTPQQVGLLEELRRGPLSMTRVAAWRGISPAAATALVRRLVDRGFVERLTVPTNRRLVLVQLTPKGDRAREESVAHARHRLDKALGTLTPQEREDLKKVLDTLDRALRQ